MVGLNPIIPDAEDLDLIKCDDQITFELGLDDDEGLSNEERMDSSRFDEEYDEKEGGVEEDLYGDFLGELRLEED